MIEEQLMEQAEKRYESYTGQDQNLAAHILRNVFRTYRFSDQKLRLYNQTHPADRAIDFNDGAVWNDPVYRKIQNMGLNIQNERVARHFDYITDRKGSIQQRMHDRELTEDEYSYLLNTDPEQIIRGFIQEAEENELA